MNRLLVATMVIVLAGAATCQPGVAQSYQDGFKAGKDAGFKEGWEAAMRFIPTSNSLGSRTESLQNIGVFTGSTQKIPQYFIVATEGLQSQAGPGLAGGALTFGGAQLDNPEIWRAIVDRSANITGIDKQKLQLYALPVNDLVSGSENVKGLMYDAGQTGGAREVDLGSSKDALTKFGSVPMFSDGDLVMVK